MVFYRSLVLGLLGAVFLLVAESRIQLGRELAQPRAAPAVSAAPTVVDVSMSAIAVAPTGPSSLLGARPGERVVAVNGAPADEGALTAAWTSAAARTYIDVELDLGGHRRRVLVLMHP